MPERCASNRDCFWGVKLRSDALAERHGCGAVPVEAMSEPAAGVDRESQDHSAAFSAADAAHATTISLHSDSRCGAKRTSALQPAFMYGVSIRALAD